MKQQKSDGTVWPCWWHTRMFFFFVFFPRRKKQHSASDNPPSICQVNVRNICRPRESNLLPPNLHSFTRQVLSGKSRIKRVKELLIQIPTGEKLLKSKGCGVRKKNKRPHLYRVTDLPELPVALSRGGKVYKPEPRVRRHSEASHLDTPANQQCY